jgi:hypothetical protein
MPRVNQHGNMTGFSAEQTSNKNKPNASIARRVETHGRASLRENARASKRENDPTSIQSEQSSLSPKITRKPKSISSFVAGFKSAVNSKIDDYIDAHRLDIPKYNRQNHFFQSNYYDRVIRNEQEYQRIKKYIIDNPTKWIDDNFNPLKNNHSGIQ